MQVLKSLTSILFISLFVFSCGKTTFGLGVEIVIPLRQSVTVNLEDGDGKMNVKYTNYTASNCPPELNCYTTEKASVGLLFDNTQRVELTVDNFFLYKGYIVKVSAITSQKKDKKSKVHLIIQKQ